MKKRYISIFNIILLTTLIFFPSISHSKELIITDNSLQIENNIDGWIKEIDGVTVVHLKGSYYEMGYQYGSLVREKCLQTLRAFIHDAELSGVTYEDLVDKWNVKKEFVPQDHIDELQGLADSLDLTLEYVSVGNFASGFYSRKAIPSSMECCNFVCWGPATADGKMYHGSSYDVPIWARDPESGVFVIQENLIILIQEPDDGYAYLGVNIAGYIGALGGFNENGISIGINRCLSDDETKNGPFAGDKIKLAFEHSTNAEEAIGFLTENKTLGQATILSDYKIPISYVVEISANHTYMGAWNSTVESLYPFWEIDHVVRRANIYINKTLALTQRERYNPKSFFAWLLGKNYFFPNWRHYRALSIGIEKGWGNLDSNSMMNILKNTYNGKIDFLFFIATSLRILETWNQWVACPETGDMWFTLAGDGKSAFKNEVHHVNFYDFLE